MQDTRVVPQGFILGSVQFLLLDNLFGVHLVYLILSSSALDMVFESVCPYKKDFQQSLLDCLNVTKAWTNHNFFISNENKKIMGSLTWVKHRIKLGVFFPYYHLDFIIKGFLKMYIFLLLYNSNLFYSSSHRQ